MAPTKTATPAKQLAGFLAKFTPELETFGKAAHKRMKQLLPDAFAMVYDNYNFFVIGYGQTDRPSEATFSLAMQASGIALVFLQGAKLADPDKVLKGSGNQVRSVKLASVKDLDDPRLTKLIKQALAAAEWKPKKTGKVTLVIRSVSAKQRPRRK